MRALGTFWVSRYGKNTIFLLIFLKIELLELWDLSRSFFFEKIVRLALTRALGTFRVSRYGKHTILFLIFLKIELLELWDLSQSISFEKLV